MFSKVHRTATAARASMDEDRLDTVWAHTGQMQRQFATRLQRLKRVKANFSAKFNVYSDIADAETLENSSSQCSEMFRLVFILN